MSIPVALVLIAIMGRFLWYYVEVTPAGIEAHGALRRQFLRWNDIQTMERSATGVGTVVLWKGGFALHGKSSAGKHVRIGIPGGLNGLDNLAQIVEARAPKLRRQ